MGWTKSKGGVLFAMPIHSVHQGHSGSRKVKIVCKPCNNGWMSRLETRTRRVLMPLAQGISHRFSTFDQKVLATWIAKTVMVSEYVYPDHVAIPDLHRLRLYADLEPPERWWIWVAHYVGASWRNLAIYHHTGNLNKSKPSESDTQFTSIGIGHLFIQVASTTVPGFEIAPEDETGLIRIWPPLGADIQWPASHAITDAAADYIAASPSRIAGEVSLLDPSGRANLSKPGHRMMPRRS
jgi:hypothetical protein